MDYFTDDARAKEKSAAGPGVSTIALLSVSPFLPSPFFLSLSPTLE
jgi:hypothetical protein